MMLLDEGLRQREPQAGTALPSRHERKEDAIPDRVRYTGPVVDDMQFQCQSIALLAEGYLPADARAEGQLRVGRSSRISAFSSTKRMDWSSSTIQIGFM